MVKSIGLVLLKFENSSIETEGFVYGANKFPTTVNRFAYF